MPWLGATVLTPQLHCVRCSATSFQEINFHVGATVVGAQESELPQKEVWIAKSDTVAFFRGKIVTDTGTAQTLQK